MKKLFLLISLLYGFNTNAQMWFADGATWHYSYSVWWIEGSIKISLDGDTLINGIDAKKIRISKTTIDLISEEFQEDVFDS